MIVKYRESRFQGYKTMKGLDMRYIKVLRWAALICLSLLIGCDVVTTTSLDGENGDLVTLGDLGTLMGRTSSVAFNLDDSGQIVGRSETDITDVRAVLWSTNQNLRSGAVSLPPLPTGNFSIATAVNSNFGAIGESGFEQGSRAVLWRLNESPIVPYELSILPGGSFGAAYDINNLGLIVGEVDNPAGTSQAALWRITEGSDELILLLSLIDGFYAVANAINNTGQIVGEAVDDAGLTQAVLWVITDTQVSQPLELIPLEDSPAGQRSAALAINDFGQIVGEFIDSKGLSHAVVWSVSNIRVDGLNVNATVDVVDLGLMVTESAARGINNNGLVAGWRMDTPGGNKQTSVWNLYHECIVDCTVIVIAPEGIELADITASELYSISSEGRVVGKFRSDSGFDHAFIAAVR